MLVYSIAVIDSLVSLGSDSDINTWYCGHTCISIVIVDHNRSYSGARKYLELGVESEAELTD